MYTTFLINPVPFNKNPNAMKLRHLLLSVIIAAAVPSALAAGELDDLRQRADALHAAGKNDSAMIVAEEALRVAEDAGDTTALIGVHSSLGVYLRTQGKLDEALKHYNAALKMCTTEAFKRKAGEEARQEAAVLYLNLATLHVDMKHKNEALYYARLSENWGAKCADKELKSQLFAQNGLIFMMCGDDASASRLLSSAYGLAAETGRHGAALSAAAYMVALSDRKGDAKAEALWRGRCRRIEVKVSDTMTLMAYYQILCGVEMNHGRWREAITLFDKILSLDGVEGMPFVVYDCYNNMHEAWARLGEWRKAYDCLGKAAALKDSLYEKDKAESLGDLTVKYQTKEKELALVNSEARLLRTRMYMAVAALVVLVCAVLVSLYVHSQRRKAREREAEFARLKADTDRRLTMRYIDGLETERERLAKELHDGVCNDLYTVELLLAANPLQTSRKGTDGEPSENVDAAQGSLSAVEGLGGTSSAGKMLAACREQVRRVSHELMPPEFKYADISMVLDDYIGRMAAAAGCEVVFTAVPDTADWTAVPDAAALEIYRIAQEAVANAVKHSGAHYVDVTLDEDGGDVILTIADDGEPAKTRGAGIGRRTMRQRAEAVGGRLTMERRDGKTIVQFIIHNS